MSVLSSVHLDYLPVHHIDLSIACARDLCPSRRTLNTVYVYARASEDEMLVFRREGAFVGRRAVGTV